MIVFKNNKEKKIETGQLNDIIKKVRYLIYF